MYLGTSNRCLAQHPQLGWKFYKLSNVNIYINFKGRSKKTAWMRGSSYMI